MPENDHGMSGFDYSTPGGKEHAEGRCLCMFPGLVQNVKALKGETNPEREQLKEIKAKLKSIMPDTEYLKLEKRYPQLAEENLTPLPESEPEPQPQPEPDDTSE